MEILKVLLVDDDSIDRMQVRRQLRQLELTLSLAEAETGQQALAMLAAEPYDIVFLDYQLPGETGLTVLHTIRERWPETAVIVMTGQGDELLAVEVMKAGASDYCPKDKLQPALLERLIRYVLEAQVNRRQLKAAENRIWQLAYYDQLTGLPNRSYFQEALKRTLQAEPETTLVLIYCDIDRFKFINDHWGHRTGDQILREAAARLQRLFPEQCLARMGDDEFIILLEGMPADAAGMAAEQALKVLQESFVIEDYEIHCSASLGVVSYPEGGTTAEVLLRNLDVALTRAKSMGKNTYQMYSRALKPTAMDGFVLENELHGALKREEFILYYQPRVSVATGRIVGAEALIRWESPLYGLVPPGKFIPVAEESGLIIPIGEWALREVCRQQREWQQHACTCRDLPVAVNFSARQIFKPQTLELVRQVLAEHALPSQLLEIEITESVGLGNEEYVSQVLQKFKKLGLEIAIDDFGTGYSSLVNLILFPITILKIDRQFIKDLTQADGHSASVVTATIAMAKKLGLKVVAEGVETEAQLAMLRELGCDEYQGFLFSRPVPPELFRQLCCRQVKAMADEGAPALTE